MHRNMAIYCARSFTGCTNREIGRYFGAISYSAVTKAKDRFEKVLLSDRTMRRIFEMIKRGISRFKGLTPPTPQLIGMPYSPVKIIGRDPP